MPLDEQAVYRSVLDLIYFNDGNVPDDDKAIACWVGCDPRVWRRIKASLIARERIHIHDGVVHDSKCDTRLSIEVARATSQKEKSALGVIARATAKAVKKQPNPELPMTYADPRVNPRVDPLETTPGLTLPIPKKVSKNLSSFGTTSEWPQPSRELIEHESKTRPSPPGSLATAHLDSALTRPADAAAELPSEASKRLTEEASKPASNGGNPERPFSRAEAGKPDGWDWEKGNGEGKFYAALGSPEQRAWENHLEVVRRDEHGGWNYPAQWPPGAQP
jgi:hypothetical protein